MAVGVDGSVLPTGVGVPAIVAAVTKIGDGLAEGVDAGTWQLSDDQVSDLVRVLGGVRAGLDELTGRVVAEVRRRDLPTHEGVASLSQWLQVRTKATPAEAAGGDPVRHSDRTGG